MGGSEASLLCLGGLLAAPDESFVNPALDKELIRVVLVSMDGSNRAEEAASGARSHSHIPRAGMNLDRRERVGIGLSGWSEARETTVENVWDARAPKRDEHSLVVHLLQDFLPLVGNHERIRLHLNIGDHLQQSVASQWRLEAPDGGVLDVRGHGEAIEVGVGIVRGPPGPGEEHVVVALSLGLDVGAGVDDASVHIDADFRKIAHDVILD